MSEMSEAIETKQIPVRPALRVSMTRFDKSDFLTLAIEDKISEWSDSHYKAVYERNYCDAELKTEYLGWKTVVHLGYSKGWAITKYLVEPVFKDQPFLIDCKVYETARFSVDFDTVDQAKGFREKAKRFLEKTVNREAGQYPVLQCEDRESEFKHNLGIVEVTA